jgi:hypothetical protein
MAATRTQLAANLAASTLASNISNVATTCTVAAGEGAFFPSPSATQFFAITFVDASTGTIREIAYCTSRTGDVLTIVRGQEGTSAVGWSAGDKVQNLFTAGSFENLVQPPQLQSQAGNYAVDSGSANAIVVTLAPVPAAYVSGLPVRVTKIASPNTTAVTINVNGLGVKAIVHLDGTALVSGDLPASSTFEVVYDGTNFVLQGTVSTGITSAQLQSQAGNYAVQSPDSGNTIAIALSPVPANLAALLGAPIRITKSATANTGGCTLNVNGLGALTIKYANGGTLQAGDLPGAGEFEVIYDGTQFVMLSLTGSTQIFNFLGSTSVGTSGFFHIGTLLIQWGQVSVSPSGTFFNQAFTFPASFSTACFVVIGNSQNLHDNGSPGSSGSEDVVIFYNLSTTGATLRIDSNVGNTLAGTHTIMYIAIGH